MKRSNKEEKNAAGDQHRRNIARVLLFIILLGLLGLYLTRVFSLKDDKHSEMTFRAFYAQKNGTLDGIYLGSSAAYRYWIPTQAYDKYGMAIFNLGTGTQPVVLQKYIIKEALKSQPNMKVILIDIRSLASSSSYYKEADIRRVTDAMKPSKNRTDAINAGLKYYKAEGVEMSYNKKYYYYPFLLYHNRWKDDLTLGELTGIKRGNKYKGFIATINSASYLKNMKQPEYTDERAEPENERKKVLQDLLDYCSTLDQKVIFVSSPYDISKGDQKLLNSYMDIIRDAGFETLDYNSEELADSLGLDWDRDFMDSKHVNYSGAQKFTSAVSKYIHENVDLEDHRSEDDEGEDYRSWVRSSSRLARKMEKITLKNAAFEFPREAIDHAVSDSEKAVK
jgi:hypothetical protein